jgi:hypothetical protein
MTTDNTGSVRIFWDSDTDTPTMADTGHAIPVAYRDEVSVLPWSRVSSSSTADRRDGSYLVSRIGQRWRARFHHATGHKTPVCHPTRPDTATFHDRAAAEKACEADSAYMDETSRLLAEREAQEAARLAAMTDHDVIRHVVWGTDEETGGRVILDILEIEAGNPDHMSTDDIRAMYPGREIEISSHVSRW